MHLLLRVPLSPFEQSSPNLFEHPRLPPGSLLSAFLPYDPCPNRPRASSSFLHARMSSSSALSAKLKCSLDPRRAMFSLIKHRQPPLQGFISPFLNTRFHPGLFKTGNARDLRLGKLVNKPAITLGDEELRALPRSTSVQHPGGCTRDGASCGMVHGCCSFWRSVACRGRVVGRKLGGVLGLPLRADAESCRMLQTTTHKPSLG